MSILASTSPTPAQAEAFVRRLQINSPFLAASTVLIRAPRIVQKSIGRYRPFWLSLVVLLYICSTIHVAVQWNVLSVAIQTHGTSPDFFTALVHPDLKGKILALVASLISFTLADVIMIWRCWVIWGCKWILIVPPILASIAGTVCAGLGLAGSIAVANGATTASRIAPLVRFSIPFLSCSLAVTLYTTGFIIWRIIIVQRSSTKRPLPSDYRSIIEILIESSALYSASLFVFVVLLAMKSPSQVYPQNFHPQIAGIAPTLLIVRVFRGHARRDEEWTSPTSALEFSTVAAPGRTSLAADVELQACVAPENYTASNTSVNLSQKLNWDTHKEGPKVSTI
ncbi:hypothetical protein C8J57DRAFT_1332239 [Mycena rebaudengoi]|nr:hypothetical protein C8J57DRAFT_1332239 [Mycena rebaudengoi]